MNQWKYFAFGVAVILGTAVTGVLAQGATTELTCPMSAHDQSIFQQAGLPDNAGTVMHVRINSDAQTATDWATYPGETDEPKAVTYATTVKDGTLMWSTPPDPDDGKVAVRALDQSSNTLLTLDPDGNSTTWNCH